MQETEELRRRKDCSYAAIIYIILYAKWLIQFNLTLFSKNLKQFIYLTFCIVSYQFCFVFNLTKQLLIKQRYLEHAA